MKADNSYSFSSSSLLNIMIPKFQQLSPLETPMSGTWLNNQYSTESTNKLLSPPNSTTPTSTCTDLSESKCQPIDLSQSSSLLNLKKEPNDSMILSSSENKFKPIKRCSDFSIDHLLSSSFRTSNSSNSRTPYKQINSIFSKKKTRHFSDNYLHQIINRRKISSKKSYHHQMKFSNQPRHSFLRYIFDFFNDLINRKNEIKTHDKTLTKNDPLEQLAELACKLDRRDEICLLNENLLLKQCYFLIKKVYQKFQYKKIRKRLNSNWKFVFKQRFLHFLLSILNCLQMKQTDLESKINSSDYHLLTSDITLQTFQKKKPQSKSICFHLKPEQISSNLEILVPNNGLLYEAMIQPIEHFDDLLLIRLNHERQNYLIPIHDLCRLACLKMIPTDLNTLSKGSRVCAYWSTSLRGLHPAIVKKVPIDTNESSIISLVFDDGDSGLIKLNEIRLLPDNYDVKDINLEEWRVTSFQIPSKLSINHRRTSRRASSSVSINTNSSVKRINRSKSSAVVPQWTFNSRNSTICRHDKKQIIHVDDCVLLHGIDPSLSYIGKVLKFYHDKSTEQDMVRLKWYYSPKETPVGIQDNDLPGALYESTHIDENPISTIRFKGTIYGSYDDYVKKTNSGIKRKETDFYLVGHYNPKTGKLRRYYDQ